ncbi:MAG TPA: cytochrome C peroxidase, partial [Bacteroidia bacterium]|nr:cytochrome C peroxidase [Bacteroidia bacterium]
MKKILVLFFSFTLSGLFFLSFVETNIPTSYALNYQQKVIKFETEQSSLFQLIQNNDLSSEKNSYLIRQKINEVRNNLKAVDFWFRYLEPIAYKKINGPLPVEWETEVFEKFEKPYKREGAGLTLASLYLDEEKIEKNKLL